MKKQSKKSHFIAVISFLLSISASAQTGVQALSEASIEPIQAPFDMPQLQRPAIPKRSISITQTGARQGSLCTKAIAKAIDRMAKKGGGTVVVPQGKWLTGRITLKSNIELRIEKGAELHFSGNINDYLPAVATRNEGVDVISLGALVYAYKAENIALTGQGKLVAPPRDCPIMQHAKGSIDEALQQTPFNQRLFNSTSTGVFLPVFFGPMYCKNVIVEGLTFENSLFWNLVPCYCENVIIRGCTVSSRGIARTDGIDLDSSRNCLVEYTTLDTGDDCFTLKSGRGMDGKMKNMPTENVVIRHCKVLSGVGGITIGSETAAMRRNVYAYDGTMKSPRYAFYFKTRRPRGGGGENLWFENIKVDSTSHTAINWDMLGSATYVGRQAERFYKPESDVLKPVYRNIFFKDITINKCPALIKAKGLPESPIENVSFENLQADNHDISLQDVGKFSMKWGKTNDNNHE